MTRGGSPAPRPDADRRVGKRVRRLGLGVFFASVAVNAALGIYAVLAPEFGETQGKILGTSFVVTAAALLALACEPAWERRLLGPVPYAGAALSAIAGVLAIAVIWAEPASDDWGRALGSIVTLAIACAAASLFALARLAPRHAWVFLVTLGLLALGAVLVCVVPWLGDDPSEWYLRVMGVVMIALAAFAVTVPVLHWIARAAPRPLRTIAVAVTYCPYCGTDLSGDLDSWLTCPGCGREFLVSAAPAT